MHGVRQRDQGLVGPAAARLPWLCPPAAALVRLAGEPVPVAELANDVGLVLLSLRYVRSSATAETYRFSSLRDSVVAEAASKLLEGYTTHLLNPGHPVAVQLADYSRTLSQTARRLAEEGGHASPDAAAAVGLLVPLGRWAVAAVDPDAAAVEQPASQRERWGMSADEIARRLCSRWKLPTWVSATITTLSLGVADAVRLGADVELAQILRDASQSVRPPRLQPLAKRSDEDPRTLRLLPELLRSAARARRAGNEHRLRTAEDEVDRLHQLLADVRDSFEVAVRDAKLAGLAEVAAGAGHEINNPLAVISGKAQWLRKGEADEERRKTLDSILRQSARISEIIRELMQYARPASPSRSAVDRGELAAVAVAAFQPQAAVKGVRLGLRAEDAPVCQVDYAQVRKSLDALIQNAIEATPGGGEVRVSLVNRSGRVKLAVEDTGEGPSDDAVPHLFDPFFSGRPAGRGRGLGLATAWRLASVNGGDLRYERGPDGPTRFELVFPSVERAVSPLRITA